MAIIRSYEDILTLRDGTLYVNSAATDIHLDKDVLRRAATILIAKNDNRDFQTKAHLIMHVVLAYGALEELHDKYMIAML